MPKVRTRVTCNLPVNNVREERAFFNFMAYLDELRHRDVGARGYTHSEMRLPVFHGYWWPEGASMPIHDMIVICTIDFLLPTGSQELSEQVRDLKQTIRKLYRRHGSPQEEVWVVVHPIVRQD
jgi:hypothetical protein